MSNPTHSRPRPLRIGAAEVRTLVEAGEPVLFLDARSAEAWEASPHRVRGAVRVRPDGLDVDPAWPREHLLVVYCA